MGQTNDMIEEQAREWFVLLNSGTSTQEDRQQFDLWLSQSDENIRTYVELEQMWETLAELQKRSRGAGFRFAAEQTSKASESKTGFIDKIRQSIQSVFEPLTNANHWGIKSAGLAAIVLALTVVFFSQGAWPAVCDG